MGRRAEKQPRGVIETSPGSNQFGIRVTDANGKRPEKVIGTLAEAIKAAEKAKNKRRRSKVLAPEKPKPTFRQIADLGIKYAMLHHAHPSKMESMLNHICIDFGNRIADTISTTEIMNWLDEKAAERDWSDKVWDTKTKKDFRGAIRRSYQEAMRLELVEVDPTAQIVYHRQPQKEIRTITPEELDRVRASIAIPGNYHRPPYFCRKSLAQMEIALQTGMRKSEQFNATWEKIDWKRCVLFIPKSKNTLPRDVYLNSYVRAILHAIQADQTRNGIPPTGKIFDIIDPKGWFNNTLKYAQIKGVTWHTLRHNFATHLVHVKVPIKFVQDLMGHLDWESTARYIHPADKDVMAGVATITDDSIPEYLMNKSYIQALLDDDADSAATLLNEPGLPEVEPTQEIPVEVPVNKSELPPRMLTRIPREELYELVWSEPVLHAAKRIGRSDVALAKACRKLNVPVPGRGYWRKLVTGKPVPPRPPLPPLPSDPQK